LFCFKKIEALSGLTLNQIISRQFIAECRFSK